MWATLAMMSALSGLPAQNGQLKLSNARFTYGVLGQERKDTSFLPGDVAVLTFNIEGLKVAADGSVRFSLGFELTSKTKNGVKTWYKKDAEEVSVTNTLGGGRRTEFATANIGADTPPGEYTMTVTVADLAANSQPVTLRRSFTVKAPQFGIVRPSFMYIDMNARNPGPPQIAPPLSVPGKHMLLDFAVIGFVMKGDNTEEPNLSVKMEVRDRKANAPQVKAKTLSVTQIDEGYKKLRIIPLNLPIQITRAGNFTVDVTVTDNFTKKTDTLSLNLKVVDDKEK